MELLTPAGLLEIHENAAYRRFTPSMVRLLAKPWPASIGLTPACLERQTKLTLHQRYHLELFQ